MYAEIWMGYVSGEGRGFPSHRNHSVLNTTRNLKRYNRRARDGDEGAGRDRRRETYTCLTWDKKNVLELNVLCNALVQNKHTGYMLSGG